MSAPAELPPGLDPRWKQRAGIAVLEHGLPELPAAVTYQMSVPVAYWTTATCAVVLFLEFSDDGDDMIQPMAVMGTFSRDGNGWTAHRHWLGTGWSHDPVAEPDGLRIK